MDRNCRNVYTAEISRQKFEKDYSRRDDGLKLLLKNHYRSICEDYEDAALTALDACKFIVSQRLPAFSGKMGRCMFRINMEPETSMKNVSLQGQSAGLGLAVGIMASFLKFDIREDVAVTGAIDGNGQVKMVEHVWEKMEPCINGETYFKRILIPYTQTNHPEMKSVFKELEAKKGQLQDQKQTVILCSTLLEALVYTTTVKSFKRMFKKTKQWSDKTGLAPEALDAANAAVKCKGRVFGSMDIEYEINKKSECIFDEIERDTLKARIEHLKRNNSEVPDDLHERYKELKRRRKIWDE